MNNNQSSNRANFYSKLYGCLFTFDLRYKIYEFENQSTGEHDISSKTISSVWQLVAYDCYLSRFTSWFHDFCFVLNIIVEILVLFM